MIEQVIADLKRHEGLRAWPYWDLTGEKADTYRPDLGCLTIGYGINLNIGLSEAESELLLRYRAQVALNGVQGLVSNFDRFDEVRQGAMLNWYYNIGGSTAARFRRFLAAASRKDYEGMGREWRNSRWARQVGHRANELIHRIRTGEIEPEHRI